MGAVGHLELRSARWTGLLGLIAAIVLAFAPGGAAAAAPDFLIQFGERGALSEQADAGHTVVPRGVATDPVSGHVYVANQGNSRIEEFTAWGVFVKAWGWGVRDGSAELQTCTSETGCQKGLGGGGVGQFSASSPQGLAVDSVGAVYAVDWLNRRVQKFDPTGGPGEDEAEFLLTFGGAVNETSGGNLCPRPGFPGDACKAGTTGTANGQFEPWQVSSNIAIDTKGTATADDDEIYVGDKERIQVFDSGGIFKEAIGLPGKAFVATLAADTGGSLYVGFTNNVFNSFTPNADVLKLNSDGVEQCKVTVSKPTAIAIGLGGVYVVDAAASQKVRQFSASDCKDTGTSFGGSEITTSTGIGTNPIGNVYVTNGDSSKSYIRAYGPEPREYEPPPEKAPSILSQHAASVGTTSAVVQATIDPEFWQTDYYVEYGPTECKAIPNPCADKPTPPGIALAGTRVPGVAAATLDGLSPDTEYFFRFVAESEGGGPVHGVDPDGKGPEEASLEAGLEGSFATYRTPAPNPGCSNKDLRGGAAAFLPDCRGFEMVSPVEKNGSDVDAFLYEGFDAAQQFPGLDQSTPDGAKLAYTATGSFGDAQGSPFVSEYIASRGAAGWSSEPIAPPGEGGIVNGAGNVDAEYKAFSPDLCTGWLIPESGMPLTSDPEPIEGFQNIYRRDNCATPPSYTWLESSADEPEPCVGEVFGCKLLPELQGFSEDGSHAVFRINDALTPEAPKGIFGDMALGNSAWQLYGWTETEEGGVVRLISILPNGLPFKGNSSAGTESLAGPGLTAERLDTFEDAVSDDGTRVYWTQPVAGGGGAGNVFLRLNADRPHPETAVGTGDLSLLAKGTGDTAAGSTEVVNVATEEGIFAVGEGISGPTIPAGTTIAAVGSGTLMLSAPATTTGTKRNLFSGSKTVANVATSAGSFAVGQRIFGAGIPVDTTIAAVGGGALTLSAGVSVTKASLGVALTATSECTEPQLPCTVPVSGLLPDPPGPLPNISRFWTASPDGSRAIFSITISENEALDGDLYEYEYDETTQEGKVTKIAGDSLGVLGASENLDRLYFAAEEAIPSALANGEGELPIAGGPNLYLKQGATISFIATLADEDISEGGAFGTPSPVASVPRDHVARVSPDGGSLAFVSAAQLTDYDNTDAASGEADREVYLYRAGGELLCASCNPSGAAPAGANLSSGNPLWTAAWIPGYQSQLYGRRPLSEDGNRLFFNSVDALSLRDTNGAQDVYQWEAPGSGDCEESSSSFSPRNGGCIDLISSGKSPRDSEFVDASASGDDVFIRTEESLSAQDPGLVDIYDVRVGGGETAPTSPPACEGDACQSVPAPPRFPDPASSAFNGPGNPPPPKDCDAQNRRAQNLSRRAKRLRAQAEEAGSAQAKQLRRKARSLSKQAGKARRGAKRCRRAEGGTGK